MIYFEFGPALNERFYIKKKLLLFSICVKSLKKKVTQYTFTILTSLKVLLYVGEVTK